MQTTNQKKKAWSLQDVILLAIIAIFFGIIYQLWGYTYYALAATPLKVYANDATLGVRSYRRHSHFEINPRQR